MKLSSLLLAVTLGLICALGFGWVDWSGDWIAGFAGATAVVIVLEALTDVVPNLAVPKLVKARKVQG